MASEVPPTSALAKKRPWYLVAALVAASVFGVTGAMAGCDTIDFYKQTRIDAGSTQEVQSDSIATNEDDRAALKARVENLLDVRDAAKRRLFPLGVAEMLLGTAIFLIAGRAMAGRLTARNMLLQLIAAQLALAVTAYVLTPDLRRAHVDLAEIATVAKLRESTATDPGARWLTTNARPFFHGLLGARLGLQTIVSIFILLALTRPRSREFFNATGDAIGER